MKWVQFTANVGRKTHTKDKENATFEARTKIMINRDKVQSWRKCSTVFPPVLLSFPGHASHPNPGADI